MRWSKGSFRLRRHSEQNNLKKPQRKKGRIIIIIGALMLAAVAGWFVTGFYLSPDETVTRIPLIEVKESSPKTSQDSRPATESDMLKVKIFLPGDGGLKKEDREIKGDALVVKVAERLVSEYLTGLQDGLKDTRLIGVYRDRANIFYIDLSDEFRRNFSGGVREEFYLLKSLCETIVQNIPGTEDVKLLVEGKEIESIGGHFLSLSPLRNMVEQ